MPHVPPQIPPQFHGYFWQVFPAHTTTPLEGLARSIEHLQRQAESAHPQDLHARHYVAHAQSLFGRTLHRLRATLTGEADDPDPCAVTEDLGARQGVLESLLFQLAWARAPFGLA